MQRPLPQVPPDAFAPDGPAPAWSSLVALPIAETFVSIQGEGRLTGVPSAFIRVSGCNLRCAWCDTPFASWSPEGATRSVDDLVRWVLASGVRHAVLTGGEPMLFPALRALNTRLRDARIHTTIETAGTVIPPEPGAGPEPSLPPACDLMSISPKLANSTPHADPRDPDARWAGRHEQRRINIPVLQRLLDIHPAPTRQLKFVVSHERDLDEINALLTRLSGWTPDDVLLMPEGVTPPTPPQRDAVVRACIASGYRYCHRLHIELFGHTRGT